MGIYANWFTQVSFDGKPQIQDMFAEVAKMERGIVRFVTLDAIEAQLNGNQDSYVDVKFDFLPEEDYFSARIGQADDGSADAPSYLCTLFWNDKGFYTE